MRTRTSRLALRHRIAAAAAALEHPHGPQRQQQRVDHQLDHRAAHPEHPQDHHRGEVDAHHAGGLGAAAGERPGHRKLLQHLQRGGDDGDGARGRLGGLLLRGLGGGVGGGAGGVAVERGRLQEGEDKLRVCGGVGGLGLGLVAV